MPQNPLLYERVWTLLIICSLPITKVPTETRKTYRAVLSDPKLVIPEVAQVSSMNMPINPPLEQLPDAVKKPPGALELQVATGSGAMPSSTTPTLDSVGNARISATKRPREEEEVSAEAKPQSAGTGESQGGGGEPRKKKKRKKNKGINMTT